MDTVINVLADRIWQSTEFQNRFTSLNVAWLQRELRLAQTVEMSDADVVKCAQAAAILSTSSDPARQAAAYSIATCVNDLRGSDFPGLGGVLRLALTRMGNFPALGTSESVNNFRRLPTRLAIAEEARRISNVVQAGSASYVLTDFQRKLWQILIAGRSVAISAPTSGGKSFILQAYLRNLARQKQLISACYLVPSRALIAQVTDTISAWRLEDQLRDLSIINVPLTEQVELPERAIYVLTQERLQVTMNAHPHFAPEIVICDEAQGIQDGARGVLLHNVIDGLLLRVPHTQLVFAGPNIRNLSVFREIFGRENIEEIKTLSPAVVQNLVVVNTRSVVKGRVLVERFTRVGRESLGTVETGRALPSIKERLIRIAEHFGQSKPSIVYANRPSDAEGIALGLAEASVEEEPSERLKELSSFVKSAVHEKYDLARCLLRRVGFHYGRIPALVRQGVESAFADGEIRFLVTTSTLIQGVNFPAANLFVCQPRKGQTEPLNTAEFWNLAGRAGRLGKEFQGNIFLIDYDTWLTFPANEGNEIEVQSFLKTTLSQDLGSVVACALEESPQVETERLADIEAAVGRLLADHMKGRLSETLYRCGVPVTDQMRVTSALDTARSRITLPSDVLAASPTVSAMRQQRLAKYLANEIRGGGIDRLEELIPRHPRDPDAWPVLSEIYRICHEQILTFSAPRLHLRMAAISLKWMKGDPIPEIIDENHRRKGGNLSSNIRITLNDIEQEIRFKYLRLTTCYIATLAHVLGTTGHVEYRSSLSPLPAYLEVGASDQTMISFISLGMSRLTARLLTELTINKEMNPTEALLWLRAQDFESIVASPIVHADIQKALANANIN